MHNQLDVLTMYNYKLDEINSVQFNTMSMSLANRPACSEIATSGSSRTGQRRLYTETSALSPHKHSIWKLNTSNPGKFEEFKRLFAQNGSILEGSHFDLEEIDANPIQVVAHKASQLADNIVVEDSSLDVEGASVGVNIRWLLDQLSEYKGRKAEWIVLLAFRQGQEVYIYRGSVTGTIILPRGDGGFGFDPVFLPDGATKTLAESKPDMFNARAKAIEALIKGEIYSKHPLIEKWEGPWQKKSSLDKDSESVQPLPNS